MHQVVHQEDVFPAKAGIFLSESKRGSFCYNEGNVYCIRKFFCYSYPITPDEVVAVL